MRIRPLVWGSLLLFLVSFSLPAFGHPGPFNAELKGHECAWRVLEGTLRFELDWDWLYFAPFNLSNLLMLTAPFLLVVKYRDQPTPRPLLIIQSLLLLHVASWWVRNLDDWGMIRSGYCIWLGSMTLMLFASQLHRRIQLPHTREAAFDPVEQSG